VCYKVGECEKGKGYVVVLIQHNSSFFELATHQTTGCRDLGFDPLLSHFRILKTEISSGYTALWKC